MRAEQAVTIFHDTVQCAVPFVKRQRRGSSPPSLPYRPHPVQTQDITGTAATAGMATLSLLSKSTPANIPRPQGMQARCQGQPVLHKYPVKNSRDSSAKAIHLQGRSLNLNILVRTFEVYA